MESINPYLNMVEHVTHAGLQGDIKFPGAECSALHFVNASLIGLYKKKDTFKN